MVLHHDGIPFHRGRRDICKVAIEVAALGDRALQDLELMAVHMPGVQVAVVVVDDDLHDLAVLDDEGIYLTVYRRIRSVFWARRQRCVQCWFLRIDVCLPIDGVHAAAVALSHTGVEDDLTVDFLEEGLVARWHEDEIVDKVVIRVEFVDVWCGRKFLCFVIDQPCRRVGVEPLGDRAILIEEHHVDVHRVPDGIVPVGVVLGFEQDAHALAGGQPDLLVSRRVRVHPGAVHLNDTDLVVIEDNNVAWPVAHANQVDEVCLVGLHAESGGVKALVDQSCRWQGFIDACLGADAVGLVLLQKNRHLLVVMVGQSQRKLVVVGKWRRGIPHDERTPQAVGILSHFVRVIPISPGLIDLSREYTRLNLLLATIYLHRIHSACCFPEATHTALPGSSHP